MKTSVLYAGLASPYAGWVAIDEMAELFAKYFKAEILSPKPVQGSWLGHLIRPGQVGFEPLHSSGGDVLIVVGRGPGDLGMVNAIPDCRKNLKKFTGLSRIPIFSRGL